MGSFCHLSYRPSCTSSPTRAVNGLAAQRPATWTASLLDPRFDSESCGVGFVAQLSAEPSHDILQHALTALARLAHRGAVAADGKSSDGVGVTTAIPRAWLLRAGGAAAFAADDPLGVAVVFIAQNDQDSRARSNRRWRRRIFDFSKWRPVPVRPEVLGEIANSSRPAIWQVLITADDSREFRPPALPGAQAVRALASCRDMLPAFPRRPSFTRRSAPDACCRTSIPISPIRNSRRLSRFFISAMRPTCCLRGAARSRFARWRTTARSTPSGAIARAWKPAPPRCRSICTRC